MGIRSTAILLIGAAACGPFTSGDVPADEGATTTSSPDGGTAAASPEIDGGTPVGNSGAPDAGPPQLFTAHDLRVQGLSGGVVYAHRIKAKEVCWDELVMIEDSELPEPGDDDVHGGVISATEVHVHDVEADWVHAGTLYVHKLETK